MSCAWDGERVSKWVCAKQLISLMDSIDKFNKSSAMAIWFVFGLNMVLFHNPLHTHATVVHFFDEFRYGMHIWTRTEWQIKHTSVFFPLQHSLLITVLLAPIYILNNVNSCRQMRQRNEVKRGKKIIKLINCQFDVIV